MKNKVATGHSNRFGDSIYFGKEVRDTFLFLKHIGA
jgi:hypothetical protein